MFQPEGSFTVELGRFFGFLHPALVHFPLVLLLVSVGLETIGYFKRDARLTWAAQILLLLGVVGLLFAFVAGNFAEIFAVRDGIPHEPIEQHELFATATSWLFVFLAAARLFLGKAGERQRRWMAVYLASALGACVLLAVTGHRGAMLVYERGAGVQFHSSAPLIAHEDLSLLNQKQDPDALFYSNQMHHIFGWMVLALSVLLLLDMRSPQFGERMRKVGPLLLLLGGAYLMVYSDTDSWPLSPLRPITDKEVLMHKTYATLMLLIGIKGLWRRGAAPPPRQLQSRTMAVFALIGGALLFTHVHSNAPFANVAVGVYLHHTVMGVVAICIGTVKLLEDELPQEESRLRMRRTFGWAYAGLMGAEAILLLNYNEGLPWFLGYRNLSLHAPHQGLIAPLGRDRAELTYDPAASRFDLYVLEQSRDAPRPLPAPTADAIIRVGTEATDVPLKVSQEGGGAHYTGTASFLQGLSAFQVQALVPRGDHAKTDTPMVADFEPWIDTRQAVLKPPHCAYVCPMHAEQGGNAPGRCALCGMTFIPNKPPRPWNKLHDDAYRMELMMTESAPSSEANIQVASSGPIELAPASVSAPPPLTEPRPNCPIHLKFTPRRQDGSVVRSLDVVHTKKLHLIIASHDLSYFAHVHPKLQPDGSLTLDCTFPAAGEYVLFADLTPTGDRNQVFRLPVTVAGTPPPPLPLIATPVLAKQFGSYRVALTPLPDPLLSKDETQLRFTVYENGKPVSDLEPFLGAGGHCVILSEDSQGYLHSHPLAMGETRYGPSVIFHTLFPRPGLYKIWAQFQHHGRPLTADFVVRVQ